MKRTLTTADGLKLEGTILSKDVTSIQFRHTTDGKVFMLELNKLSSDDQKFIAAFIRVELRLRISELTMFSDFTVMRPGSSSLWRDASIMACRVAWMEVGLVLGMLWLSALIGIMKI